MSDNRTASILQRVPVILKVTAASYGLDPQGRTARRRSGAKAHKGAAHGAGQRDKTGRQR